jgi:hypothetical protein
VGLRVLCQPRAALRRRISGHDICGGLAMTRKAVLSIAAAIILAAGAAGGVLFLGHGIPAAVGEHAAVTARPRGGGVPAGARSAVSRLLSGQGRAALTPELRALLPNRGERLFPAGSRFTPGARSWHQAGHFANVTGALREPGKAPVEAEIGLVNQHGRWLVTFEGTP